MTWTNRATNVSLGVALVEGCTGAGDTANTDNCDNILTAYANWGTTHGDEPKIAAIWRNWDYNGGTVDYHTPNGNGVFPTKFCEGIRLAGGTAMIYWEPRHSTDSGHLGGSTTTDSPSRYTKINDGTWDTYITAFAAAAASWGHTVLLRMYHEFDSNNFSWSLGGPASRVAGSNTPAQFKGAWQRIHGIFQAQGATNVKFVWCPQRRGGGKYGSQTVTYNASTDQFTCTGHGFSVGEAVCFTLDSGSNSLAVDGWLLPTPYFFVDDGTAFGANTFKVTDEPGGLNDVPHNLTGSGSDITRLLQR